MVFLIITSTRNALKKYIYYYILKSLQRFGFILILTNPIENRVFTPLFTPLFTPCLHPVYTLFTPLFSMGLFEKPYRKPTQKIQPKPAQASPSLRRSRIEPARVTASDDTFCHLPLGAVSFFKPQTFSCGGKSCGVFQNHCFVRGHGSMRVVANSWEGGRFEIL